MGCGGSKSTTKPQRLDEKESVHVQPVTTTQIRSASEDAPPPPKAGGRKSSGPRLFVFDFDLTIMKSHMWATFKTAALKTIVITDTNFVDIDAFRDFVKTARSLGHEVAIATFGRKDVVNKAMCHAFGDNHGIVISSPADHGAPDGTSLRNKNQQLNSLAQRFSVELSKITFFDDDEKNVKEALTIGVKAIHTPNGITATVLRAEKPQ